jgi:hypothetical protein
MGPSRHTSRKLQRKLKQKSQTKEYEETGLPVACALSLSAYVLCTLYEDQRRWCP